MVAVDTELLYTSIPLLAGAISACCLVAFYAFFWCFINLKYCVKLGAKSLKTFNLYEKANAAVQRYFPLNEL